MHADGRGYGYAARSTVHIGDVNAGAVAGGAAAGAAVGSVVPGIGTAIGGAVGAIGGVLSGINWGGGPKYSESDYEALRTECRNRAPGCYPTPGVPPDQPGGCTCPPQVDDSPPLDASPPSPPPPPPPPPRPEVKFAGTFRVPTGGMSSLQAALARAEARIHPQVTPAQNQLLQSFGVKSSPPSEKDAPSVDPMPHAKTLAIAGGALAGVGGLSFLAFKLLSKSRR